ncbi:hypothetical protein [Aquibacillus salsiterrae]|uniref:Uncharacterized protein n=1 Tax=Aquibacillus salsiterrae TaxID=2950439 RepID=A0A9X3WH26_9BACI|nr:hypothetical protein [Aquibacillus salsiterrae]MDC3417304.1 hypothetical protein [Aquibacillus salsiterrae]
MSKTKKEHAFKKSYESDGIMGKTKNTKSTKKEKRSKEEDPMFFNTTESSE